jgi:hypothetical protein
MGINRLPEKHNQHRTATYEVMVYAIIFITAILFRFVLLGEQGLNDGEAIQALQVLDISNGQQAAIGSEPGYVGLTSPLFRVLEGSNFLARFWPAVFGSLLALVPFLYRAKLGKVTALLLAALIALDPGMISLSRTAGSSIIGITSLLACLGFILKRKAIIASIFGGLALISGSAIWPGIVVLGLVLISLRSSRTDSTQEVPVSDFHPGWKRLVLPGLVVTVVVSSQFLVHVNGISGIGGSLARYLESWAVEATTGIGNFFVTVFWLQLPILVFGLTAIIIGLVKKERKTWFLGVWWALALLVVVINPSRNTADLGLATVPLLVLSAIFLSGLIKNIQFDNRIIALAQFVLTILMISLSFYYLINITNAPEIDPVLFRNKIIGAILPLFLLIVITILFTWGWNSSSAKTSLGLCLALLGVLMIFSNGWKATGWTSPTESELWAGEPVVIGDEFIQRSVSDQGRWTSGQASSIDVEIAGLESPSMNWALKKVEKLTFSNQVNQITSSALLVTPAETALSTETSYRGEKIVWSSTPDIQIMNIWDWIKWTVFRNAPMKNAEIIFWARNDLFKTTTP